jgi:hypothetical protein
LRRLIVGGGRNIFVVLSAATSTSLQDLIIHPYVVPSLDPSSSFWSRIASALKESQFSHLSRIVFGLPKGSELAMGEKIREQWPVCHQRGILAFVPVDKYPVDDNWWSGFGLSANEEDAIINL